MNPAAVSLLSTTVLAAVLVGADSIGPPAPPAPYGPCFQHAAAFDLVLEATGTCRCADGQCKTITCTEKVGASLEDSQRRLKAQVEFQARQEGGHLEGEISFRFVTKF